MTFNYKIYFLLSLIFVLNIKSSEKKSNTPLSQVNFSFNEYPTRYIPGKFRKYLIEKIKNIQINDEKEENMNSDADYVNFNQLMKKKEEEK